MTRKQKYDTAASAQYRIKDNTSLVLRIADDRDELLITVEHDEETVYSQQTSFTDWNTVRWWSDNHPSQIVDTINSEVPDIDRAYLVKELRGAFFAAGIDLDIQARSLEDTTGPDVSDISGIQMCEPNLREPVSINRESRWEDFENDRYEAWKNRDCLEIWGDQPGLGKTTNVSRGAARRDDAHVIYLPKHENCREFETDPNKPSIDLHLKGPKQPTADSCMDAKVEKKQCQDQIGRAHV